MLGWLGYGLAAPLKMTWLVLYFIPLASETTLHEMFLFHNAVLEDIITYLNKNMLLQVFAHVLFWAFWWRGRKTGKTAKTASPAPHRHHSFVWQVQRFGSSASRSLSVLLGVEDERWVHHRIHGNLPSGWKWLPNSFKPVCVLFTCKWDHIAKCSPRYLGLLVLCHRAKHSASSTSWLCIVNGLIKTIKKEKTRTIKRTTNSRPCQCFLRF